MQLPLMLDRSRPEALTGQLVAQLRDAIRNDMIAVGTRLPSSRRLADQLGIARNTATRAYDVLALEGFAEARPASGVFASKPNDAFGPAANRPAMPLAVDPAQRLDVRSLHPTSDPHRLSFDFQPGRSNASLFPLRSWRRHLLAALSRGGATELSRLGDPAGLFELRSALAKYISATRGMVADPSCIIITSGAQEAFSLIGHALLGPNALAAVEDPGYASAARAFQSTGAELVHVPLDIEGVRPDALPQGPVALLYVTPAHQYPTGRVMPMSRRRALIEWARRSGCVIVEDDYDGDIRYEGSPLPAIAGAAPDCTIHVGSFTTTLGAGLRLGYMVVPPSRLDALRAAKSLNNHGNAWLEQATLAPFIHGGGYATHVAHLRAYYRERRDALLAALARHFGEPDVSGEANGLHLLWNLPPGMPEASTLQIVARRARVGVYPLAAADAWSGDGSLPNRRAIVLGFGLLTPRQIADGIARLSDAVDDRLDRHHDFLPELLVHEPHRPSPASHPRTPAPSMHRRLALSTSERRRPMSKRNATLEEPRRMSVVSGIYRYPVKGMSAQALHGVYLEAGRPFPFDRIFALARSGSKIDQADPQWAKKGLFVMLMLEEALAEIRTDVDVNTMQIKISAPDGTCLLSEDLETASGRAAVETLVAGLVTTLRGRPALVRSRAGHFMDKPDNVISLINLATLRELEERWGYSLDPLRFRANVYIDGASPWEEFDWVGSTLRIGEASLRVDRRNGRCGATNVDPWTGRRDREIPTALRAAFGHKDLGLYLMTEHAGTLAVGDTVSVVPQREPGEPAAAQASAATDKARFICRGCYYIYDEKAALKDGGRAFAVLPADWQCPDCGTDATKYPPLIWGDASDSNHVPRAPRLRLGARAP